MSTVSYYTAEGLKKLKDEAKIITNYELQIMNFRN